MVCPNGNKENPSTQPAKEVGLVMLLFLAGSKQGWSLPQTCSFRSMDLLELINLMPVEAMS